MILEFPPTVGAVHFGLLNRATLDGGKKFQNVYALPMKIRPAQVMAVLAVLAASGMAAQDDVIRVNTRLVEVGVVVRAKYGPVTGLTKDDWAVFDNGKPQRVEAFSVSS